MLKEYVDADEELTGEVLTNRNEFYVSTNDFSSGVHLTNAYSSADELKKNTELLFVSKHCVQSNIRSSYRFIMNYPWVLELNEGDKSHKLIKISYISLIPNPFLILTDTSIIDSEIPIRSSICILKQSKALFIFGYTSQYVNSIFMLKIGKSSCERSYLLEIECFGEIPSPRADVSSVKVSDSSMIIHGGRNDTQFFQDIYLLKIIKQTKDIAKSFVCEITEIITASESPVRYNHLMMNIGNRILILGGLNKKRFANKVYSLDLETYMWTSIVYNGPRLPRYKDQNIFVQGILIGPLILVDIPIHFDPGNTYQYTTQRWILDFNLKISSLANIWGVLVGKNTKKNMICPFEKNKYLEIYNDNFLHGEILPGRYYKCHQIPNNISSLHTMLGFVFDSRIISDLEVRIADRSVYVNQLFLAARRSESMHILSKIKNGVIQLKGEYEVARSALYYLYTDEIQQPSSDFEFYEKLMGFSIKYKMDKLKFLCQLALSQDNRLCMSKGNLYEDYKVLHSVTNELSLLRIDSGIDISLASYLVTDFSINTPTNTFMCHKPVLFIRSGFFRGQFINNPDCFELELNDYSDLAITSLLEYIYTDDVDLKPKLVPELLALSTFLQVEGLKLICQQRMIKHIDSSNAENFLQMALELNTEHLIKYIQDLMNVPEDSMEGFSPLRFVNADLEALSADFTKIMADKVFSWAKVEEEEVEESKTYNRFQDLAEED